MNDIAANKTKCKIIANFSHRQENALFSGKKVPIIRIIGTKKAALVRQPDD